MKRDKRTLYAWTFFLVVLSHFEVRAQICSKSQLPTDLQGGLVGFYPFCGDVNDASGLGNHGTAKGAVLTTDRFGNPNSAYFFDGVDDWVEVANSASLTLTGEMSMSAWVNTSGSNGQNYQTIVSKRQTYWTWEYAMALSYATGISHNTRMITSRALGMGNGQYVWSAGSYSPSKWELWTVVFSTGKVTIYRNGVLDNSASFNLTPNAQNCPLLIGRNSLADNSEQFFGKIDEVAIWNRAITPQEIAKLYQVQCGGSVFNPLPDTTRFCGSSVAMDAGSGFSGYTWSTGAKTRVINPSSGGIYSISVSTSAGCSFNDSTYLSLVKAEIAQNDTSVCKQVTIWLSASLPAQHFVYNGRLYQVSTRSKALPWGPQNILTGASSPTDGAANTRAIVAKLGAFSQGDYAAFYCDTLTDGGFADWFMPATQEAQQICTNISSILGFNGNYMHTSTEESIRDATRLYLAPGSNSCGSVAAPFKEQPVNVLPVRTVGRMSFRWSTGDTTQSISINPSQTTTYRLTVSDGITSCVDSVRVTVDGIAGFNPFNENLVLSGDSLILDAGPGYGGYQWNTGAVTQRISVASTGRYWVTVRNASGCTASDTVSIQVADTVRLSIPNVQAVCNATVDVEVKASSFKGMLSIQGSLNWNPSDLRFDSVVSYGPSSMSLNSSSFGTNRSESGVLAFSWNDAAGTGVSLTDSTILFKVRFKVLSVNARSLPVTISSTPTPLEFIDVGLSKKPYRITSGSVIVSCELKISGRLLTPVDHAVRKAEVELSGSGGIQLTTTDSLGGFGFKVLPGTHTLTPSKTYEQNKLNGVSTLDIAHIQAHILQRAPLNSAYKVIAADVDRSSSVTTADLVVLRRLILGIDTTLPGNSIWVFVDGDQTFSNPHNPFPFNSTKTFGVLSTDVSQSFRGIKIGDVNYDRNPMLEQSPSGDTLTLFYTWTDTDDGRIIMYLRSKAINRLMGWQSTLKWDPLKLELESTLSLMDGLGSGDRWKREGRLTLSWNDSRANGLSFSEGMKWIELRFRKTAMMDRTSISLTDDHLGSEVFNDGYQRVELRLQSAEIRGGEWLGSLRVYPNPVGSIVNVEWNSKRTGEASLRLLDPTGRVVYVHRGLYGIGIQRHSIRRSGFLSIDGVWTVQIEQGGSMVSRPLVVIAEEPCP